MMKKYIEERVRGKDGEKGIYTQEAVITSVVSSVAVKNTTS
jgi:hypothetical protein